MAVRNTRESIDGFARANAVGHAAAPSRCGLRFASALATFYRALAAANSTWFCKRDLARSEPR